MDGGGPKRELFSIISREIFKSMFEANDGDEKKGVLRHDVVALQVNVHVYNGTCMQKCKILT